MFSDDEIADLYLEDLNSRAFLERPDYRGLSVRSTESPKQTGARGPRRLRQKTAAELALSRFLLDQRQAKSKTQRALWVLAGRCVDCNQPRDASKSRWVCASCLGKNREKAARRYREQSKLILIRNARNAAARRARHKALGLCVQCNNVRASNSRSRCVKCLAIDRQYHRSQGK